MWNLHSKGAYNHLPSLPVLDWHFPLRRIVPLLQLLIPVVAVFALIHDFGQFSKSFLHNPDIPTGLLLWGSLGQFIYKTRFIYQWWYSYRRHESLLPRTFWLLAVIGSAIIISYAIIRLDWILLVGQVGIVAFIRNLIIDRHSG